MTASSFYYFTGLVSDYCCLWSDPSCPTCVPLMLFDNPGISKCLNTLHLLSPHFCFIIGFICDFSVVHNDSRMSKKTSLRTKQIYVLTSLKAEGEIWDLLKLALDHPTPSPSSPISNSLLTVPRWCFHCGTFC